MGKITIGDRIRVYGFHPKNANEVFTRTVVEIGSDGILETDYGEFCHPKQCRKLKPKKRREWWIVLFEDDEYVYERKDIAEKVAKEDIRQCELIHVREVREK